MVPLRSEPLTGTRALSRPVPTRTLSMVVGKLAPVIVTAVPPPCGPLFGLTPLTVAGGTGGGQPASVQAATAAAHTMTSTARTRQLAGVGSCGCDRQSTRTELSHSLT